MHWHCYSWVGVGDELWREAERRPVPGTGRPPGTAHPLPEPDPALFSRSHLPPMRTGDWLLKPRSRISLTGDEVGQVLAWLRAQYAHAEGSFLRPDQEARIGVEYRLEEAADLLARGVDVQWGIWLQGGRYLCLGVVCCPHAQLPHPCPAR
ncbi:hypothetical protein [Nonomuraea sp. NPDC004354]